MSDAYENIDYDLAKFKPITIWSSQLSPLIHKLYLGEIEREWLNFPNMQEHNRAGICALEKQFWIDYEI